jgi:hypothetical protein
MGNLLQHNRTNFSFQFDQSGNALMSCQCSPGLQLSAQPFHFRNEFHTKLLEISLDATLNLISMSVAPDLTRDP